MEELEIFSKRWPPPPPPLNGGPFVVGEIGAGLRPQYAENLGEVVLTLLRQRGGGSGWGGSHVRMAADMGQLPRDIFRRKDKIHDTGGDRALGHARELGRALLLGESNTALALDCPQAKCTVRGGSGKDDTNRLALVNLGQRLKEIVDRHMMLPGLEPVGQDQ